METKKPVSKETLALIRKCERQIKQFKKLQSDYDLAKKSNPGLRIDFFEDHPDESQIKSD